MSKILFRMISNNCSLFIREGTGWKIHPCGEGGCQTKTKMLCRVGKTYNSIRHHLCLNIIVSHHCVGGGALQYPLKWVCKIFAKYGCLPTISKINIERKLTLPALPLVVPIQQNPTSMSLKASPYSSIFSKSTTFCSYNYISHIYK